MNIDNLPKEKLKEMHFLLKSCHHLYQMKNDDNRFYSIIEDIIYTISDEFSSFTVSRILQKEVLLSLDDLEKFQAYIQMKEAKYRYELKEFGIAYKENLLQYL